MSKSTEIMPENAELLANAWYQFMGYTRPEYRLRETYDEIKRPKHGETQEEIDLRITKTEIQRKNHRKDLLNEIRNGAFKAFGRDITNNVNAPLEPLPNSIFEELDPKLSINWDLSRIELLGKTIIDVCVSPNTKSEIAELDQADIASPKQPPETAKYYSTKLPNKAGAKSQKYIREAAIIASYKRHNNFEDWSLKNKMDEAKSIARELFPDLRVNFKFGRTSFYDTIKNLKESGRLPSKNVRK